MSEHIRSNHWPEFTAKAVREWLGRVGSKSLYIEPGSPWENGYVESFNDKLRDELLDREVFYTLLEVEVLTEQCQQTYNGIRLHSSLGKLTRREFAVLAKIGIDSRKWFNHWERVAWPKFDISRGLLERTTHTDCYPRRARMACRK